MGGDNKGKLLREAEKYVLQGKHAQAITEYLKVVKTDPNDVLILNTIGDLYLRQGKAEDARKYFLQVAENYARNNFLLKAIAVYRKILSADPDDLEVSLTLASLHARQGQTGEARNRYLRVAELFAEAGKQRESLECYEKVVELDPDNSAVQLRLAEVYLADGAQEKAHSSFAGAARAQAKAGDLHGALDSFKQATQLNPVDLDVLKGFLDTAIQLGDISSVLEQLSASLKFTPDNLAVREMLGQAYLAASDPGSAANVFAEVISQDESRYPHMLQVSKAFLKSRDTDQAACCLDPVVPILISRRDTDRAVEAYNLILKMDPQHVLTLTRLAGIYSATNNHLAYVETMGKVAAYYLGQQSPSEAIECIQKILLVDSENPKYLAMHRRAFTEAFPGKPYHSPTSHESSPDPSGIEASVVVPGEAANGAEGTSSAFVDIDLLLTYGMKDRAIEQLCALEAEDPWNPEVRRRLFSLYKETKQSRKAADQCLMLAALSRRDGDDASAQKSLADARKLAPELVGPRFDLDDFAQRQGIVIERAGAARPEPGLHVPGIELDLSGDLSEMFFKDDTQAQTAEEGESSEEASDADTPSDEYTEEGAPVVTPGTVEEQLQEVDFYIRLGFYDEARAKLDEMSKDHPNNPELPRRYRMLPGSGNGTGPASVISGADTESAARASTLMMTPEQGNEARDFQMGDALERMVDEYSSQPARDSSVSEDSAAIPLAGFAPAQPQSEPIALAAPAPTRPEPEPIALAAPFDLQLEPDSIPPAESYPAQLEAQPAPAAAPPPVAPAPEREVNNMFADLIDEVNALTDQEIAREEFENHFNLGIAYREMALIEEAIREFQEAVKAMDPATYPKQVIQCCGMLSTCFLEKEMPRSAIRWCQTGLNIPEISSHESMALRYDMAVAYSATGETERALESFSSIFGIDPSYRDVAQKIDCLRGGPERHGS